MFIKIAFGFVLASLVCSIAMGALVYLDIVKASAFIGSAFVFAVCDFTFGLIALSGKEA